ncbi:DEAD-box ATP-dependent RNA helicase FANCM isoform X2 [Jatropha curcas]|uniref:DEAD-box ATP-dependent RNA helicase FANCM isoform X2 n=1 Tax=Jatropha curcas TaxID=180498 RepID=UPI0009D73EF7|nr:DEAD-box ATP-dependent RNA helicase FANCM isoform X2 [Jatropha curcas]
MTSTSPLHVPDNDDDEFDWEAAVREIDVACQSANNPSTSLPNNFASSSSSHSRPLNGIYKNSNLCFTNKIVKKSGACKQSTLDMFIGKGLGPGPRPGNSMVDDLNQQVGVEGNDDERASYVEIDPEAAKTWIYPVNVPLRDYQLAMTKTALFSNTLVALPTGLGKTLIAAVVMYNYFRWFPYGKIVFAAPSRPLVMQQIEACHNIVGIPQEWTIDMTGQLSPTKRACFWKTKRVFFVTPQVLEKDIQSGTCLVRYLVCLVIDEAHRALGNYSYCVAVRELMAVPVQLRILALTATPGSKQQAIQHIIDNLHISTLEYRNEDDPDVSPYVHNRKIEMIEVALGKDAVDVNKQLLEVIRPYVARLSAIGLLHNRDYKTFSPPDLLNSRDKFRRAPPPELPQNKYGEIEAYFAGLITLYHIRKLLSSHGIRPAYEMLEEKLKQGPFARLMTRNEDIRKVKLSMQQSLSHGAPSPKLSKMLEVLVDHFKTKDPQNSRVIIFSNFRGSVRDIMNALTNIGDIVKATEFIGQSSGKALKGQSQKVQQAVLEKFRAGKYNVIVATSIGEEGLDIMEVDLVICFDANVSPLRMIQRMGRTGRKHDGRVVVLACEGSELKGYMRKQANSRAIKKHMHNGGINSFNFHPSPRMIPHIFKPEVQFVKLSIEQYIPRGKKVKDDTAIQTPVFRTKLNGEEAALITKYFKLTGEQSWRPSLIAFPHFQAFPSRVHKVMHSYRTNMLIDTMQYLQNLSFSTKGRAFFIEDEISSGKCLGVDAFEKEHIDKEDPLSDGSPATKSLKKVTDYELSATDCDVSPRKTELHNVMDFHEESPPAHSYLFGSDFVSVNALGNVIILSVPVLPMREALHSKCTNASTTLPLDCLEKNSHMRTPCKDSKEVTVEGKSSADLIPSWMQCETNVTLAIPKSNVQQDKILDRVETAPETPGLKKRLSNERDCADEALDRLEINGPSSQHVEYNDNAELSPRLTNMIQSGIVPESPINDIDASAMKLDVELLPKSPIPGKNETAINVKGRQRTLLASINNEIQTPILTENNPAAEETNTPLVNPTENSCSKDWLISSGDKSETVEQVRKLKRLRKIGDMGRNRNPGGNKEISLALVANLDRSFSNIIPDQIKHGKRKQTGNIFIEEEAEVSSDAEISVDEEDDKSDSSYDDSFIDDRTNPTAASTQAETCRADMMGVYRRSLLSQSPMERESSSYITATPDCGTSMSRMNESKSSSVKTLYSFQTPYIDSSNKFAGRDSGSFQMDLDRMSEAKPHITTNFLREKETMMESRKRKLSFCMTGSIPAINLEQEFSLQSDAARKESFQQDPAENLDANGEMFHDDQFFANLDLDAVEAQATMLLKHKSESSVQNQDVVPKLSEQNFDLQSSPTFDLGIG